MIPSFLAFCILAAGFYGVYGIGPVSMGQDIKIYPSANVIHHGRPLGVVYGTRSCGGPGKLVGWRVEGCDTRNSPCRYPIDDYDRHGEIEFIPSATLNQLGFRMVYRYPNSPPETVFEKIVDNSLVIAGVKHVLFTTGHVTRDVKSNRLTSQFMLFRLDNGEIEFCAEADFELV